MNTKTSLALMQSIADSQKNLIIILRENEPVLINSSFKEFFSISSLEEYKENYDSILNSFFPHPSYFSMDKAIESEEWYDTLLKLPGLERVVSMMTLNYEPCAFAVEIDKVEDYVVITFEDITQSLIKRIMVEEHSNMDLKSNAYSKKYFFQIKQSYQDAALLNEKIIAALKIKITPGSDTHNIDEALRNAVVSFKSVIRQDDMLIRWEDDSLLLVYLVESIESADVMLKKLQEISKCSYLLRVQNKNESIDELIDRVNEDI